MTQQAEVSSSVADVDNYLRQPYARIILPESDGTFRGEIMEFPGCIAVGESASEALENLEEAAKGWLLATLESGQNIPQPIENSNDFSGRLVLRIPKSIHKKASWIAEREGVSLNQFITSSLAESIGERQKTNNVVVSSAQPSYFQYVSVSVNNTSVLSIDTRSSLGMSAGVTISGALPQPWEGSGFTGVMAPSSSYDEHLLFTSKKHA